MAMQISESIIAWGISESITVWNRILKNRALPDYSRARRLSNVRLGASVRLRLLAFGLIPAIDLTLRRLEILRVVWIPPS